MVATLWENTFSSKRVSGGSAPKRAAFSTATLTGDPHRGETMRYKLVLSRHREPKGAAGVGEGTYSPKPSGEGPGGRLRFRGQGAVPLPPQIQREQGTREVRANIAFLRRSAGDEACVTSNHLRHKYLDREKVLATMTRLMNAAYFRVGDERFAK